MKSYFYVIFILVFLFAGCSNIPSTEDIEADLKEVETEISEATKILQEYSGGLIYLLANVRLEVLKTTKSMLEQKKSGYRRFIPLQYTVDGKEYVPPQDKDDLLQSLNSDLQTLDQDLMEAEKDSSKYGGGLLGVLALTKVTTLQNSKAFLNQRRLLLKYDIPYYAALPNNPESGGPGFKSTPGKDIDKF